MSYKKIPFWFVSMFYLIGCAGLTPKPVFTPNSAATVAREKTNQPESDLDRSDGKPAILKDFQREKLMATIENLLGVPYRKGSSTLQGMDCSGFVQYAFSRSLNFKLPRQTAALIQMGEPVQNHHLQFGDLVFFRDIENRDVSHVGIYLEAGRFAHASLTDGVVISNLTESYYQVRFSGSRRVYSQ